MIVADASVLIALAKMRRLDLLHSLYGDVLIGPQVKAETVDAGKRISASGVARIEKALDDGWLQVARLSSKEKRAAYSIVSKGGLDVGEAESLALALASFCSETKNITSNQAFANFSSLFFHFSLDKYVCSMAHIIHET